MIGTGRGDLIGHRPEAAGRGQFLQACLPIQKATGVQQFTEQAQNHLPDGFDAVVQIDRAEQRLQAVREDAGFIGPARFQLAAPQ